MLVLPLLLFLGPSYKISIVTKRVMRMEVLHEMRYSHGSWAKVEFVANAIRN
ncbi:hypothetical protein ES319_A10G089500v1 [Gossypium barbadense]|uniref:Uncharacterized protein n=2 Tax=Gossypium TaxID=3633 RepID=A0A5J5U1V5_GOSBA|nr:hypothetical protein ES319_A10G089500v1 [Gossypium barbadense]TYI05568.1 hypothetical protein ES332_A10G097800v1 [Gossypium tomentosum]